jgi:RHS repeat-associated protein
MSRLVGMTDGNNATVATAQYDGNSQLSELDWGGLREVRQYNQLQQLTRITTTQPQQGTTWMDMQYIYVAGANNGRVTQTLDGVTGDTQAFGYDALNRLVSVTSSLGNNESMAYDGFGNLTSMNGVSYTVDATTNRRTGGDGTTTYDANGNVTQWGQAGYGWDIENRMTSNGAVYDPWGKRVGVGTQAYFYSLSGQRLTGPNGVNRYFGGKLIQSNGVGVATDRLGSVRANGNGDRMVYTAYGAERTSTADGREKFGTYFRDGTGLDYADQRYYGDSGRFLSVDPGNAGDPTNPTSLNRYAYVLDDPINNQDPEGLCTVMIGGITQTPYTPDVTAQQDVATQLGAISAYPYAGGSIPSGVANVLAQGAGLPTGAALVALDAIALAAQNPGQIDIIAFSGGAQAFTTAWGYLSADVQSRIGSITYVDPGAAGQLTAGNPGTWGSPGTDVKVIEDSVGFANTALQLLGSGTPTSPNPPGAEYVDAGGCGHDANCVFAKFLDWFQGSSCQTGAGGVFGAPVSHTIQLVGNSSWWAPGMGGPPVMVYWWELPPVPSVSSTIKYNLQ